MSAKYGNTQGNVSNGGIAVLAEGNIFFANFSDSQKLYSMKANGTDIKKMTEESVNNINYYEGWIYYRNFNNSDKIYKIKPDGTGRKIVYKWKSQAVNISGGWFFLSNGNDHNRIYRVRLNGKNELQLNNDESSNLCIDVLSWNIPVISAQQFGSGSLGTQSFFISVSGEVNWSFDRSGAVTVTTHKTENEAIYGNLSVKVPSE